MKFKALVFISALAILVAVLPGCGAAEVETTVETQMQTVETTAETTEATTEATEPPTVFEEMGLTLWEECSPIKTSEANILVTRGKYPQFGAYYHVNENDKDGPIIASGIMDSTLTVTIREYPSVMDAKSEVDEIYMADAEKAEVELTKEEWLAQYEGYKLLRATCAYYLPMEELVDAAVAGSNIQNYNYGFSVYGLGAIDRNSGEWMAPTGLDQRQIGRMEISYNGNSSDIVAFYNWEVKWKNKNGNGIMNLYVLVPENYDALAFKTRKIVEGFRMEDETYENFWEYGNIRDEELEEGVEPYYFAMIKE